MSLRITFGGPNRSPLRGNTRSRGQRLRTLAAGSTLVLALPLTAWSQTNRTWAGAAGTDWFNPTNWVPAGVPAANDTITFSNGTINLTAPVTIAGQFNWSGGALTGAPLTLSNGAVLVLSGSATKSVANVLTNAGTVTWTGGTLYLLNNNGTAPYLARIENLAGALWDIQCDQTIYNGYGTTNAYFHNLGTLQKSAATGTTSISIPIYNAGTVIAQQGVLNFNNGGTIESTFSAAGGAAIHFGGGAFSYATAPTLNGPGAIQLAGGTLTLVSNMIPNLQMTGGTVSLGPNFQGGTITNLTTAGSSLSGSYTVTGGFNCGGGVTGSLIVSNGGVVNWSGGTLGSNLWVNAGGLVNWSGGVASGPITVANGGALVLSGTGTKSLYSALTNAGTVTWTGGTVYLLNLNGTAPYVAQIENLAGALWDIQCDQTIYNGYGTTNAYFHNLGTLQKSAATGTTSISIPIYNAGTVIAQQGVLNFNNGGTIESTFSAAGGAAIHFGGGAFSYATAPTLNGPGAIQLTGGTLTLVSNVIPNLQLTGGTVSLGPNFQGGTITNLALAGSTLTGSNSVSGTFNWSGGTLTGNLWVSGGGLVNWSGGIASGPITVANGGALVLSGAGTKNLYNVLTNAGTVTWTGGTVYLLNLNGTAPYVAQIENLAGALWDIQCDQTIYNGYGTTNAYFHNLGTLQKSAATGTTSISIPIYNAGTVIAQQGVLNFNNGGTIESTFSAAGGAAIHFGGGAFSYATAPTLNGPGAIQLAGGTLTLVSNMIPNLQMTGGTVSLGPNFQGGTITNLTTAGSSLSGSYTVTGGFNCGGGVTGSLIVSNGGVVNWSGGTLGSNLWVNAGGLVNWSGGVASGPITVANGGALVLSGAGTKNLYNVLTNAGTVTWTGGTLYLLNLNDTAPYLARIENLAGALWDIQCDQTLYNGYGTTNAYFHNLGTLQKSAATGTTFISLPCLNAGTLNLFSGTLNFNAANTYAQTGATLGFGIAGANRATPMIVNGNLSLDGTLNAGFLNGYTPKTGDTVSLIACGTLMHTFNQLDLPPAGNHLAWRVAYATNAVSLQVISNANLAPQITGSVTDTHGAAVTNIAVFAFTTNSNNSVFVSTLTDAGGNYALNVTNGIWAVGVEGLPARGYNAVANQTVMVSNASQIVNFVVQPYSGQIYYITTAVNPAGAGTTSGDGAFSPGSTVTVIATASTNPLPYFFTNWTENGVLESVSSAYTFTASRDRQLVANFTLPIFAISATNNPAGAGTVSSAGSYYYGQTSVLTAQPSFGYSFAYWSEGTNVLGTNLSLSTVVYSDHSFAANYSAANLIHVVTTATSPSGLATVDGAGTYTNGQTANFSAPSAVTNSPYVYAFKQYTASGTLVGTSASFSKTFSTLDATNLHYVAVYSVSPILPALTNVTANYANPVPATPNFLLAFQFDRSLNTNVAPTVLVTNAAAPLQVSVSSNGTWVTTVLANDTYKTPAITFVTGMDGTNLVLVSRAQDLGGDVMAPTNAVRVIVDATPPPPPVVTLVSSNASGPTLTIGWQGYGAPPDLAGFRIYLRNTNFSSVAGLPVWSGAGPAARSFQFYGLSLDAPYYTVVQAFDLAGNSSATLAPLGFTLPSTVPPPVGLQQSPVGSSSAYLSWNSYDTSTLFGFAGFRVYSAQSTFTSVAGMTPVATLGPSARSYQANGLDRSKTYYFAVVGYNGTNGFNPAVGPAVWTDPYAGSIAVNTTIGGQGQGVVNIYQNIVVVSNASLTIQPGTTLWFALGTGLTVQQGSLVANGTALHPIILDSANDSPGNSPAPGDWAGVSLGSGAGSSSLRFVEVLYGGGLTLSNCSPTVDAFTASYNSPCGLNLKNGASLVTSNALLTANVTGAQQSDSSVLTIQNAVIQNNVTNAAATGSSPLSATSAWWGTTVESNLATQLLGNVVYHPFLGYEPLLTPAFATSNGVTQVGSPSVGLELACRTADSMRLSEDPTFAGVFFVPFSNFTTFQLSASGGLKRIYAQYRSLTGQTNAPIEQDVNYVNGGPVIQSFSLAQGKTLGRPLTVTGSATSALGMADMEFYVDGVLWGTNAGGTLSLYFDVRTVNNAMHQVELLV